MQRRLARSHASGTLCNPARRRFEVLRRELPELDRLARDWDEYLQPLADAVPELPPRAAVWRRIEAAITPKPSPQTTNLWGRLAFLRGLALVSTASAFALALFLTFSGPAPPPSPDLDYVGVLSDARGQPRFVMTVSEAAKILDIRGVGRDPLPTDVSYQLWAISRTDGEARSLGLTYLYTLEFARQRSGAGNPVDYDTSYWRVSGGVSYKRLSVQLTQERLGSDNNSGFVTPLATLHKFQGWADKFVVLTPNEGLVDNFITVGGRWPGFRYRIQYHDFDTDVGSRDIGTEFGAALQHRIGQQYLIEFKYADYRAQDGATGPGNFDRDTRRVFLSFSAGFGMSRAR